MSNSFSKLIKAAGRLHEFNFRQLSGTDKKYHVDVPDGRGNRIVFYMYKDDDGWKTDDNIPSWILSAAQGLSEAIRLEEEEYRQSHSRR